MSKIIMMLPSKGGVGQTFLSVAISIILSRETEKKILLLDNKEGQFAVENIVSLSDKVTLDLSDVFSGNCKLQDVIYNTGIGKFDFIPSPRELTDVISPILLKKVIKFLSKYYDYIIVDTAMSFTYEFKKLLSVATEAIIVSSTAVSSVFMCPQISQTLREVGIDNIKLLLNKFDKEYFFMNKNFEDLDAVIDMCEAQLLGIVPYDRRIEMLDYLPNPSAYCLGEFENVKLKDKKSAFSAIKRIGLRVSGKNSALVFA